LASFSTTSPFRGRPRLRFGFFRRDECHRFLARLDGGGVARNVADNALLMRSFDQRLVHSAR
jgi:hypothetical protein